MRYFISKNQSNAVVDKQCLGGDDTKINELVAVYQANHPSLTVTELDQVTFDATVMVVTQTQPQKDWITLKSGNPTPLQAITFIAKYLGLE